MENTPATGQQQPSDEPIGWVTCNMYGENVFTTDSKVAAVWRKTLGEATPVYRASLSSPSPAQQTDRNAVLEEAARAVEGQQDQTDLTYKKGILAEACCAIRALAKSPAQQTERQEADDGKCWTDDVACHKCGAKGWHVCRAAAPASAEPVLTKERITEIGLSLRLQPFENAKYRADNGSKMTSPEQDEFNQQIRFVRAIECEVIARLAAPSSPSLSGSIAENPHFYPLLTDYRTAPSVGGNRYKTFVSLIDQHTAQVVRAATDPLRASLQEVTDVLDAFGNLPDGMMHPEPWNMRKAEEKIKRAREVLRTPAVEQEGK